MTDSGGGRTADIALGLSAGIVGAVMTSLGLTHALLVYGAIGSVIGMTFAKASGRSSAIITFAAASILSAKAGATMAEIWFATSSPNVAQGLAAVVGVFFHPLVQFGATFVPEYLRKKFVQQ